MNDESITGGKGKRETIQGFRHKSNQNSKIGIIVKKITGYCEKINNIIWVWEGMVWVWSEEQQADTWDIGGYKHTFNCI